MSITMIGLGGMVNKMTTLRVEGLEEIFLNKVIRTCVQKCGGGDRAAIAEGDRNGAMTTGLAT
jgi:hypothetical protein